MRTEHLILKNLITDEDYARRTLPYLKSQYFQDVNERIVYEEIEDFEACEGIHKALKEIKVLTLSQFIDKINLINGRLTH